jgi:hypothetical protein
MRLPVALVQLDAGPDPGANVRRAAELADRPAASGARLVMKNEPRPKSRLVIPRRKTGACQRISWTPIASPLVMLPEPTGPDVT